MLELEAFVAARAAPVARRQPHAAPCEDLALVGVVDRGQFDVLALDVLPYVEFGPVGDREDADVFAGGVPAVVEGPQFGALAARVPGTELVAQREHPLLGAGLLLVAPSAAEHRVVSLGGDGVEQRDGLQGVAGAVRALPQPAVVDEVLYAGDVQPQVVPRDHTVPVVDDLGEVVPGVDVQQGEGNRGGRERLQRQVQHDDRVLAAGEQDHRPLELARHLTEDVDGLRLDGVEMGEGVRARVRRD